MGGMSDASPATPGVSVGQKPAEDSTESPFRTASGRGVFLGGGAGWQGARGRALIALAAGLLLTAVVVSLVVAHQRAEQRRATAFAAARHATDLQNHLTGAASALYTTVTWALQGNGAVPSFEHYARVLMPAYRGLIGLDLAPEAVVRQVVPQELLGPLVGRNLMYEPVLRGAAAGATEARNLCFGEPTRLATNTPAITARLPVMLPDAGGGTAFWGLAGAYLGLNEALRAARIDQLAGLGYRYSLITLGPDKAPATQLSGEESWPANAVRQEIALPGLTLQLAIWPQTSAASLGWILLLALPGIVISLLAAGFVGALGQTRQATASALRALRDSGRAGERFSQLLASFPAAVILTKPDGRIVTANEATEKLCGYSRAELLGRPLGLLLPAADADQEGKQPGLKLGVAGGLLPVRHKEGRQFAALVQVGRLAGSGGEEALLCHVLRRPDRTATAEAAAAAEAEVEGAADDKRFVVSPVPHLVLDEDLQVVEANTAAAVLLGGRSRESLVRRRLTEFVPVQQEDGTESSVLLARQAEIALRDGATAFNLVLEPPGKWVSGTVSLVRLAEGEGRLLAVVQPEPESGGTEQRLAEVETQLQAVTDGLRDWEAWIGLEGQPLWIGGPVQNFTGYSASECLAMPDYPFPLIHEDDRQRVREALLSALQGTSGSNLEFRVVRKDGQIRRVGMSWRPALDQRRRPLGYRTSIRDVTHAREAEPEPLSDEKRDTLELALEGAEIGVWDWDLVSGRNMWDERMLRLYGLTPAEFAQSHDAWRRRLHPDDVDRVETAIQAALEGVGAYEVEHRIVLPDGRERSLASRGQLQRDADGKPDRLIGVTWDITPLRQTEEAIRHDQALLRSLLENTAGLVHVKDKAGRYLMVNRAWADCFGLDAEEVAGRTDDALLPSTVAEHFAAADHAVAEKLQPERAVETLEVGGQSRRLLFERFPMLDGGERLYALVSIATELPDNPPDMPPPSPTDPVPPTEEPVAPESTVPVSAAPSSAAPKSTNQAGASCPEPALAGEGAAVSEVAAASETELEAEAGEVPERAAAGHAASPAEPVVPEAATRGVGPETKVGGEVIPEALVDPGGDSEAVESTDAPRASKKPEPPAAVEEAESQTESQTEPESESEPKPESEPEPEAEREPEPSSKKKRAKPKSGRKPKPKPQAEEISPQELLPGFTPPSPPAAPEARSATGTGETVDLAEVAAQMGVSAGEAAERLTAFVESQRRALRDLREALEEEKEAEARAMAHAIAEAAGDHGAPDFRRLAKTVELDIRFHEGHLPAMLGELEAEADRVFAALEELTAGEPEPQPASPLEPEPPSAATVTLSTAAREVLEHLADLLEEQEPEGAAEAVEALLGQSLPGDLRESLVEVKGLIAETELPEAEALVRGWLERAG
jgi:PAS domain S-box-containing protein